MKSLSRLVVIASIVSFLSLQRPAVAGPQPGAPFSWPRGPEYLVISLLFRAAPLLTNPRVLLATVIVGGVAYSIYYHRSKPAEEKAQALQADLKQCDSLAGLSDGDLIHDAAKACIAAAAGKHGFTPAPTR